MIARMLLFLSLLFGMTGLCQGKEKVFPVFTTEKSKYVGCVALNNNFRVRLLVLRHSPDNAAISDGRNSVQAANLAAEKGLDISVLGDFRANKKGLIENGKLKQWDNVANLDGLKGFISEQMRKNAQPDDVFCEMWIGHGGRNGNEGYLAEIGSRRLLLKISAEASSENNQKTFFWDFSCHSQSGFQLAFDEMTEQQKDMFSALASSTAQNVSWFGASPPELRKIFLALAEDSKDIDPDQDQMITAKEFRDFLNSNLKKGRGDLFMAKDDNFIVFGYSPINLIPIINKEGYRILSGKSFIPLPK